MMQPFDLFFDYFAMRDNALRRLDARVKMGTAAALFLAILSSTRPSLPAVVSVVSIVGLIALKIPTGLICRRFLSPLGAVLVIVAVQAVLIGQTPVFSISLGGWELAFKREGIEHGMLVGLRVWAGVSVLLLLSSVTPAHEIFQTLHWCRIPKVWLEIAMLIYRYLFVILDEASEMVTAQRVRLGYSGFRNSLLSMGGLMGAVVVRSVEQSLRTHEAMIARGYTGEFPFSPMTGMPRRLRFALLGAALGVAFVYLVVEGWLW